ncbi:MAG: nitrous oxide reductase family maturation protein NosD [Planctomycetota bacterium]|nr:MAG: nitrous oxide reductase family maturation protein NosD [Planctomycetota bacterium]
MIRPSVRVAVVATTALLAGSADIAAATGFDLAHAVATAPPGATIRVPPGVYTGPVRLDRPLTLVGEGWPVLDGGGEGDVVDVTAPDVTVRGFVIRNTGDSLDRENAGVAVEKAPRCVVENNRFENVLFGVYMKESPHSVVRGNVIGAKALSLARRGDGIRLWRCDDSLVEGNVVRGGRDTVLWFCDRLVVRGNTFSQGRYGLHFMYSDDNLIEGNRLVGNSVGAFLMYSHRLTLRGNLLARNRGPSGFGLGLKDMDDVLAEGNRFVGNRVGVQLDDSPSSMDARGVFRNNVFAYNDIGVAWLPNVQRNVFTNNAFVDNLQQLAVLGKGEGQGNSFTDHGVGNYWSNYAGFDLDGDGAGDVPHVERSYFEDLLDRDPKLRLFLMSPAQLAIQIALRALPVVAPRVKAVDEAPRMTPVAPQTPVLAAASPRESAVAGLVLLCAAVAAVGGACAATSVVGGGAAHRGSDVGRRAQGKAPRERQDRGPCRTSDESAIKVQQLVKRYSGAPVVQGVSFAVAQGEAAALWGPNGAGKTTILRCLLNLTRFDGAVWLCGVDVRSGGRKARRLVGYVPQEAALHQDLNVGQTMALFGRLRGAAHEDVDCVLQEVELLGQRRKRVAALSGGMKRRLALAIALLGDPPVLLLDEPTANLDAEGRAAFLALLHRLVARGKTVLFTTHRLGDVQALASRVLELRQGRLVAERKPEELAQRLAPQLQLAVACEHLEKALAALRAHGVRATEQAGVIRVAALQGRAAEPLRLLFEAGVRVEDIAFLAQEGEGLRERER